MEIDGRRSSGYESVYFDTPDLVTYRMCIQQRRRRIKLRTRCYVESGDAYLEAKTRLAGLTVKRRTGHPADQPTRLDEGARRYAAEALCDVGQRPELAERLTATLSTGYRRSTLLTDDVRVTIDTDLTWELPDGTRLTAENLVIVETKSPGAATGIDRLLWRSGIRPVSLSKYATGLAALRPDLPATVGRASCATISHPRNSHASSPDRLSHRPGPHRGRRMFVGTRRRFRTVRHCRRRHLDGHRHRGTRRRPDHRRGRDRQCRCHGAERRRVVGGGRGRDRAGG
nr:VTC domain-containing protein [Tessaracoccus coleopterorum]